MTRRTQIAWGDESMRTQDSGPSRYMVGVSLCTTLEEKDVRAGFEERRLLKGRKAHWYEMTQHERERSAGFINSLELHHIIVSTEPLLETMRPERARRKCLETLLPILEKQYDVTQLFMESRNKKQDAVDIQFIQAMRLRGFISSLNYNLLPGKSDARLWIPDQVLGVAGAEDWHGPNINDCETYTIGLE